MAKDIWFGNAMATPLSPVATDEARADEAIRQLQAWPMSPYTPFARPGGKDYDATVKIAERVGPAKLLELLGYRCHGYDAEEPASSQLLLQLTGDDQTETQFGDVEYLSFFIAKSKLAKREFGKVWPKIGD